MNKVIFLSLNSEHGGSVTGNLHLDSELLVGSSRPAVSNAQLTELRCSKFVFMGPGNAVQCSFPLAVKNLLSVLSLAENAAQARFIEMLDGKFSVSHF